MLEFNAKTLINTIDNACKQLQSSVLGGIISPDLQYQCITSAEAKMAGFSTRTSAEGLTHYDIPSPVVESAPEFQRQYRKIFAEGVNMSILNIHQYADGNLYCSITNKTPFWDDNHKIEAAYYLSQLLPNTILEKIHTPLIQANNKFLKKCKPLSLCYEIVESFEELGLTVRESECFFYIIRQRSTKVIASLLNLSARTVEDYITNIKYKLLCHNKTMLVDYAFAYDLVYKIPGSLLTEFIEPSI